jgi:hypothetical protein
MNPTARAEARIKQLCCLGLPSEQVMPTLLAQMHRLISGYAYNFFWINAQNEVSNAYHENFEETQVTVPLFLSEFCNRREGEVLTTFGGDPPRSGRQNHRRFPQGR